MPEFGAACKLGQKSPKEASKIINGIGIPKLTALQKKNIKGNKISPIEVKSSGYKTHKSLDNASSG